MKKMKKMKKIFCSKMIVGIAMMFFMFVPMVGSAATSYDVGFAIGSTMPAPPLIPPPPFFGNSFSGGYVGAAGPGWSLGNLGGFGLPAGSISGIIRNLLLWLLMIFGLLGIIGFVLSGIMYILAAGDEDTIKKAKNAMKWSIIGVVVGLAGIVIIQAITFALSGFSNF